MDELPLTLFVSVLLSFLPSEASVPPQNYPDVMPQLRKRSYSCCLLKFSAPTSCFTLQCKSLDDRKLLCIRRLTAGGLLGSGRPSFLPGRQLVLLFAGASSGHGGQLVHGAHAVDGGVELLQLLPDAVQLLRVRREVAGVRLASLTPPLFTCRRKRGQTEPMMEERGVLIVTSHQTDNNGAGEGPRWSWLRPALTFSAVQRAG